jgi:hypothetical protein
VERRFEAISPEGCRRDPCQRSGQRYCFGYSDLVSGKLLFGI